MVMILFLVTILKNYFKMSKLIGKHYLFPSAIFAEKENFLVDTILGSCVAVCLYDTKNKIGGINHFMLPLWNGDGLASPKYGNIAIDKLIEKMIRNGSCTDNLVAKIFGGASQINSTINVGYKNILVAKEILSSKKITILAEDVGGVHGRKMRFDTGTNQVFVKYLIRNTYD